MKVARPPADKTCEALRMRPVPPAWRVSLDQKVALTRRIEWRPTRANNACGKVTYKIRKAEHQRCLLGLLYLGARKDRRRADNEAAFPSMSLTRTASAPWGLGDIAVASPVQG